MASENVHFVVSCKNKTTCPCCIRDRANALQWINLSYMLWQQQCWNNVCECTCIRMVHEITSHLHWWLFSMLCGCVMSMCTGATEIEGLFSLEKFLSVSYLCYYMSFHTIVTSQYSKKGSIRLETYGLFCLWYLSKCPQKKEEEES